MEEQKHEPVEAEEMTELSENSRRDFITKMVAAAGAVAVAGLAGTATSAGADETKLTPIKLDKHTDLVSLKMGKFRNGFRLSLTGSQIGEALKQVGVVTETADMSKATITIEFSA
jgi:hypothetical protein